MKKLPLLSSNFELFSWEKSIGNATDEQVKRAYEALVSQGKTVDFSYLVWNDLVDILNKAIVEADLTWDSTYASVESTKILWNLLPLNAYQFNSVTLNISKLIGTTWKWEVDTTLLGYLGRRNVYGINERKEKADNVYGWYLIELARVINVFIDILKNDANFKEFVNSNKSMTTPDVTLSPRPSKTLTYTKSSETNTAVKLSPIPSMPLYVQEIIRTACSVDLNMLPPMRMNTKSSSKTYNKVIFERIRPKYIGGRHVSETSYDAVVKLCGVLIAFSNQLSQSDYNASMMIKPPKHFDSNNSDRTNSEGSINLAIPVYQESKEKSRTTESGMLRNLLPRYLHTTNSSQSNDKARLLNVLPYYINSKIKSISTTKNKLSKLLSKLFYSNVKSETANASSLTMPKANNLESNNELKTFCTCKLSTCFKLGDSNSLSNSTHNAELNYSLPLNIVSSVISRSETYASMVLEKAEESPWVIKTGTDLYIRQVYSSDKDDNQLFIDSGYWLEPIQTGTNLYIRQLESIKGDDD